MAQDFSRAFYNSKQWKDCRAGYVASVFNLCETCRKPGYILHHKIPLTSENIHDQDITLNWKNLKYVCKDCHEVEHGHFEPVRSDIMFNSNGNLVKR